MRTPAASSDLVARRMRNTPTRDTPAELALRRALHRQGLRFRVDVRPEPSLRRKADIVFTRWRVAVFVDGCFWHDCPEHGSKPHANAEWWRAKLATTVARDLDTNLKLAERGWLVVRIWEHESVDTGLALVLDALHAAGWPSTP
jgi:DNA mismatch endonuclease (patch repair protein)